MNLFSQEYDDMNFLDIPRHQELSKYALTVALKLWSNNELIDGNIESGIWEKALE